MHRTGRDENVLLADTGVGTGTYDAVVHVPSILQGYLAEPAVEDAPRRVWRDYVLVGLSVIGAVLEAALRTDAEWTDMAPGFRWGALAAHLIAIPPSLLMRRTRPLLACAWGFAITLAFGFVTALAEDTFSSLNSTAVILVSLYALFRWGSGRDGMIGLFMALAAGVIGSLTEPTTTLGDWIGGFIVLFLTIQLGLVVRYRASARERAISEAKSLEREDLARELHDTVAHHVSAIAVQAQAGRAMAASDPERALEVLAVIEEAASRTLTEMRAMVRTLRNGSDADLAPQLGISDLHRLAQNAPGEVAVQVTVPDYVAGVGAAAQAAIYRIARESVTNALRHASGASTIAVVVSLSAHGATLTIEDDGVIRPTAGTGGASPPGYGLLGMAERTEMLGGTFVAGPEPGGGWRVLAQIPRSAGAR